MSDQRNRVRKFACAGTVAVALAACGGGDDGADSGTAAPAAPTGYAVEAAVTALYTTDNQVLSTGFIDPANRDNFYFTTRITPAGAAAFEGEERQVVQVQTTQRRNGVVTSVGEARMYVSADPLTVHGQLDDEGNYSVSQLVKALPSQAQPGESGLWYTSTDYTSIEKTRIRQTTEVSWSVQATGEPDTAWVCLKMATEETVNPGVRHSSSSCVKADHDGRLVDLPVPMAQ